MRRLLLFLVSALVCSWHFMTLAQTEQPVRVVAYQGKEAKTPLQYAEVVVTGAAAATSAADGSLTLRFRTAHPGDLVQVKRVALSGYEVFNAEALQQWVISPSAPFTIVLCETEKFRALCEQYSSVASESYRKQMEKDRARLEQLRKENKLQEEEYQRELLAVQDQYDQQLENLEGYVDHFARFDLSEISEEEQAILALVQEGRIDEAIARYEQMDLLGKYRAESEALRQLSATQDSLRDLREHKEAVRDTLRTIINMIGKDSIQ